MSCPVISTEAERRTWCSLLCTSADDDVGTATAVLWLLLDEDATGLRYTGVGRMQRQMRRALYVLHTVANSDVYVTLLTYCSCRLSPSRPLLPASDLITPPCATLLSTVSTSRLLRWLFDMSPKYGFDDVREYRVTFCWQITPTCSVFTNDVCPWPWLVSRTDTVFNALLNFKVFLWSCFPLKLLFMALMAAQQQNSN